MYYYHQTQYRRTQHGQCTCRILTNRPCLFTFYHGIEIFAIYPVEANVISISFYAIAPCFSIGAVDDGHVIGFAIFSLCNAQKTVIIVLHLNRQTIFISAIAS